MRFVSEAERSRGRSSLRGKVDEWLDFLGQEKEKSVLPQTVPELQAWGCCWSSELLCKSQNQDGLADIWQSRGSYLDLEEEAP